MGRESFGIIDQQRSGKYRARYTGPDSKRYPAHHTFPTKTAARTWLAGVQADIARGAWEPPSVVQARKAKEAKDAARKSVTFGDFATSWVTDRTNSRGEPIRPRTRAEYERLLRAPGTHDPEDEGGVLAPFLPQLIRDITPEYVRRWRTQQLATGCLTQTARAYDLLKSILKTATTDRLIESNPCSIRGGSMTSTGKRVEPPTDDELEAILDCIDRRYLALTVIAGFAGLRSGEARELRAKDITVEKKEDGTLQAVRISVERQVVDVPGTGRMKGQVKTLSSSRTVVLFGLDAEIVANQVRGKLGDALLTTNHDGTGWLPQPSFWRHWNKARTAVGRPDVPFHALRHYAGTRYAQTGATVKETMARLGHSTSSAAMRYQHSGSRDDELAMRMARRTS